MSGLLSQLAQLRAQLADAEADERVWLVEQIQTILDMIQRLSTK